jgi:zinc transport system substrate-binding protein
MEPWADKVISGMKDNVNVLDLSTTVKLINSEEFEEEHSIEDDHDHEDVEEHEEEHNHEHEEEHEHHHEYDPHIWLNPQYAIKMVESIKDELCRIDPENKDYYTANANSYIQEIQNLDNEFEETVNKSETKKIAFGGAFAYAYFIERYNLEFISAYDACGENVEPSTSKVKEVIDYINNNKLPVIFYKEYTNGNIAKTISESTGAKMLVFNTVHNVSKDEINNNASYVSIMKQNLENLKIALEVNE